MDPKGLANKVLGMVRKNSDKVEGAIDKAGDMVDKKTGGKYADKVDSAQQAAKKAVRNQQR